MRFRAEAVWGHDVPAANHAKVDPADQIRTQFFGIADASIGLPQRADIRSKRNDTAEDRSDRPDRELIGLEQAEHHEERQCDARGDRDLRDQNDLSASLGDLGELLESRLDP